MGKNSKAIKLLELKIAALKDDEHGYPKCEIGLKIVDARKKNNMTQDELAAAIDAGRTTITNIERGYQAIRVKHLILICRVLKLNANELLGI